MSAPDVHPEHHAAAPESDAQPDIRTSPPPPSKHYHGYFSFKKRRLLVTIPKGEKIIFTNKDEVRNFISDLQDFLCMFDEEHRGEVS